MPDVVIYIEAHPKVCLQRIQNRGVSYEGKVDLNYLYDLEYLYSSALCEFPGRAYHVDGTLSKEEVARKVKGHNKSP